MEQCWDPRSALSRTGEKATKYARGSACPDDDSREEVGTHTWMPPWASVVQDDGMDDGQYSGYVYLAYKPERKGYGPGVRLAAERAALRLVLSIGDKLQLKFDESNDVNVVEENPKWTGIRLDACRPGKSAGLPDFAIFLAPHKALLTETGIESRDFGGGGRMDFMLPMMKRTEGEASLQYALWVYVTTSFRVGTFNPNQEWVGENPNSYLRLRMALVPKGDHRCVPNYVGEDIWNRVLAGATKLHSTHTIAGVYGSTHIAKRLAAAKGLTSGPLLAETRLTSRSRAGGQNWWCMWSGRSSSM